MLHIATERYGWRHNSYTRGGSIPVLSGRRPPQSNSPPDSVPPPDNGGRLESRQTKDGISPLAPPPPKGRVQSLPSILRIVCPKSLSSCSKGARGLSV